MLKLVTFCFIVILGSINGHNGNNQNNQDLRDVDGILQADLMPQELQSENAREEEREIKSMLRQDIMKPEFMEVPYRPLLSPQLRVRRSAEIVAPDSTDSPGTSIVEQVKQYSRVIACFVLVVSAAIEVVVYIIEAYQVESA